MVACVWGNFYAVDYLLLCGAQVNSLDCRNRTPLHLAAWYGHEDTVQLLLEHGADFKARVAIFPWRTAKVYAEIAGHSQVVTVLDKWKKRVKEEKKAAAKDKEEKKAAAKAKDSK